MKKYFHVNKWMIIALLCIRISSSAQDTIQSTNTVKSQSSSDKFGTYTPNAGFRVANTDMGTMNIKVFTYIRYLNQLELDTSYTNAFGETSEIDRRQDIQLNKVNVTFLGWL